MHARPTAMLLFGAGMLIQSLMYFLGFRWPSSGGGARSVFVVAVLASVVGLALEIKRRREDREPERGESA